MAKRKRRLNVYTVTLTIEMEGIEARNKQEAEDWGRELLREQSRSSFIANVERTGVSEFHDDEDDDTVVGTVIKMEKPNGNNAGNG